MELRLIGGPYNGKLYLAEEPISSTLTFTAKGLKGYYRLDIESSDTMIWEGEELPQQIARQPAHIDKVLSLLQGLDNSVMATVLKLIEDAEERIRKQCNPLWIPIDDFKPEENGYCWIRYRGEVEHVWYDSALDDFFAYPDGSFLYRKKLIVAVMPITKPEKP